MKLSNYGRSYYTGLLEEIVDQHVNSIILHLHNHLVERSGLSKLLRSQDGDTLVKLP